MWNKSKINLGWSGVVLLMALFDPSRWSVPTVQAASGDVPAGVTISEGKTEQGYAFLHGGIGSEEREILNERGKAYSLQLVFAEKHGSFIAAVKLAIEGANQTGIINITTNGPWFYVDLPPGSYNVKALFGGKLKELRDLRVVKGKKTQRTIIWDLGPDTDPVKVR